MRSVLILVVVAGCGATTQEAAEPSDSEEYPCTQLDPVSTCEGVCGEVSAGCPGEHYDCTCAAGQTCTEGRCEAEVAVEGEVAVETVTPDPDGSGDPDSDTQTDTVTNGSPDEGTSVAAPRVRRGGDCSCCRLTGGANRGPEANRQRNEQYRACLERGGGCDSGCPRPASSRR